MNILAVNISASGRYKGRNKPPMGGLTSRPRSVAMNSMGSGTGWKTSADPLLSSSLAV